MQEAFDKLGVFVFFEGQDRSILANKADYVEFRWDGPEARSSVSNYWFLDVVTNFVITSTTKRADTYTHQRIVGKAQSVLINAIGVFRYGDDESVDDQSLLGCLQLRADLKDPILTNYFGRNQEVELEQSTIEAFYCLSGTLT